MSKVNNIKKHLLPFLTKVLDTRLSNVSNLWFEDIRNNLYKEAIPYLETILSIENDNISAARTLRNIYSAVGDEVNYKLMKEKVEGLEN